MHQPTHQVGGRGLDWLCCAEPPPRQHRPARLHNSRSCNKRLQDTARSPCMDSMHACMRAAPLVVCLPASHLWRAEAPLKVCPAAAVCLLLCAGQQPDAFSFENAYYQEGVLRASSVTGPGFLATNVTLLADPDAAAAMPGGYFWPDPSQLHVPAARAAHPAWVMAVIAVCVALVALILALGGYTWWQRKRSRLRDLECGQLFGSDGGSGSCKPPSHATGSQQGRLDNDHIGDHVCTSGSPCPSCAALRLAHGASCGSSDVPHIVGSGSACAPLGVNQSPVAKRKGAGLAAGAGALAGAVAGSAAHEWRQQEEAGSSPGGVRQGSKARDVTSQRDASPQSTLAAGDPDSSSLASNVAAGMQRWRVAVSSTTMLLMERRMDAAAAMVPTDSVASTSASMAPLGAASAAAAPPAAAPLPPGQQAEASQQQQQQSDSAGSGGSGAAAQQPLQLLELLGQGSFGSVFLALWHGKRVAVKVMQLPADALLNPGEQLSMEHQQQGDRQQQQQPGPQTEEEESLVERRRRLQRQRQQNSRPHMAIMEAVVSSAMSHPNVSSRVTDGLEGPRDTQQPRVVVPSATASVAVAVGLCLSRSPPTHPSQLSS